MFRSHLALVVVVLLLSLTMMGCPRPPTGDWAFRAFNNPNCTGLTTSQQMQLFSADTGSNIDGSPAIWSQRGRNITIVVTFPAGAITYTGEISADNQSMSGTWSGGCWVASRLPD